MNIAKERYAKVNADVDRRVAERVKRLGALKNNPKEAAEAKEAILPEARRQAMAQHSQEINNLTEQTILGKKLSANVGKYSPEGKGKLLPGELTARMEESKVPSAVFHDKQSVREFVELLGGDTKAAEKYGDEYAATSLYEVTRNRNVSEALSAAQNWVEKNRSWLEMFPNLQKQADAYVGRLKFAQQAWKRALGIGLGTALATGAANHY